MSEQVSEFRHSLLYIHKLISFVYEKQDQDLYS